MTGGTFTGGGASSGQVLNLKLTGGASNVVSYTKSAGTITATDTLDCGGYTPTLSLPGSTIGTGITYQWQSSPTGSSWRIRWEPLRRSATWTWVEKPLLSLMRRAVNYL